MPLSSKRRRELSAQGHRVDASLTIAASGQPLPDSVVDHVRRHFAGRSLIKVRIRTDDRSVCDEAAAALADRVPCDVVKRIGRIVLLYRPTEK